MYVYNCTRLCKSMKVCIAQTGLSKQKFLALPLTASLDLKPIAITSTQIWNLQLISETHNPKREDLRDRGMKNWKNRLRWWHSMVWYRCRNFEMATAHRIGWSKKSMKPSFFSLNHRWNFSTTVQSMRNRLNGLASNQS